VASVTLTWACTNSERASEGNGPRATGPTPDRPTADCGLRQSSVLSGSGIGDVRVGTSVAQLRSRCRVGRDTTIPFANEGMPERRVTIALGADSLEATVVDDRVWRVEVRTLRLRTADSLGVGSTVREIRRGPTNLATGDRGVFVLRRDHCGLSFQLAGVPPGRAEWALIPETTRVALVLVFGCANSESGN
jgi:hypothetical protein